MVACLIMQALAVVAHAADGTIDTSFGGGEFYTNFSGGPNDGAYAVAVLDDGKILVGGTGGGTQFAVLRYLSDGALDGTFGVNGVAVTQIDNGFGSVHALHVLPDGSILAAGTMHWGSATEFSRNMPFVAKYHADGSPVLEFGTAGHVLMPIPGVEGVISSLAVQPDGKILVGGGTDWTTEASMLLIRLTGSGIPDPEFGNNGVVQNETVAGAGGSAVGLQRDGKIVAAGGANGAVMLSRFTTDGSLDPTFGQQGNVLSQLPGTLMGANAMLVQRDGKLVVAGGINRSNHFSSIVARYNALDGSLDNTFGGGGIWITDILNSQPGDAFFAGDFVANGMIMDNDGRIVIVGGARDIGTSVHTLVRYLANGAPDPGFGRRGIVQTFGTTNEYLEAAALQGDGKIVGVGMASIGSGPMISLVRYLSAPANSIFAADFEAGL